MQQVMTAEEFCRFFWKGYLMERQYDRINEIVGPGITVIGTGAHEIWCNPAQLAAAMEKESKRWDGSFTKQSGRAKTKFATNTTWTDGKGTMRKCLRRAGCPRWHSHGIDANSIATPHVA